MIRYSSTLVILLLPVMVAWTQTVTVRDKVTLEPLEFVAIYSPSVRESLSTDARGQADLSTFAGADSIYFQRIGYGRLAYSYRQIEAQSFTVLLSEDRFLLQEVVISANRWEQDRREVPFHIATVRAREVAFLQPQTAADLLGTSEQVFIQKSQMGGGSPMIRGFSTNRILLVIDGVRMNNAIFRSGNLQNVISLDPFTIQNAEVIFGPASVIYGSDAIGGVMDFHTLLPKVSAGQNTLFNGNAALRYSSANDERTGHLDLQWGGRKWAFVSSATYSDFGDLRMGAHGPGEYLRPFYAARINGKDEAVTNDDPRVQRPSGYSQLNLLQKLRFQPNDHWDIEYGLHFSTTSDVPRYDRLIETRNGLPRDGDWYYGPQRWIMNNLEAEHRRTAGLYDRARLIAAHQYYQESRHDRGFRRSVIRHRTESVDAFSLNLDFDKRLNDRFDVFYGAEAIFNRVGSVANTEDINNGETGPLSTRYPDGSTWNAYAIYGNVKTNLSPQLTLLAGARVNLIDLQASFDTTFFDFPFTATSLSRGALTGSAGLTYRPADDWQFNVNLSTGFRAPNIDDVGKVFDSEPGSVVVPNPGLGPEYAYSADLGLVKTLGDRLRVDVTGFFTLLNQAMVRRNFRFGDQDSIFYDGEISRVQAIQNAAEARVWGLQAGMEWRIGGGFSLSSRINWQDGFEEDEVTGENVPVRHIAPTFGATHLVYRTRRFQADAYAVYNGEISYANLAPTERDKPQLYAVDDDGNPYSPGWYTLNLKASYQFVDWLQLVAGLENITDQRYRPYSSGIVAPGRNAIVTLRVGW